MSAQYIQLSTDPNQTMTVTVNIDNTNKSFLLTFRYNEVAGYWIMTIQNPTTLAVILDSIPLLSGGNPTANILGQYAYLGIGSAYIINVDNSPMDSPDSTNLGTDFYLIWSDTPAA
jgi:hypothetical protein